VRAICVFIVGLCAGCGPGAPPGTDTPKETMTVPRREQDAAAGDESVDLQSVGRPIGTATLRPDGTLVLDLIAEAPGIIGHSHLEYPPNSPDYESIKRHIGPIAVGEEKIVNPWPE
jgi:hypothetical protein